MTKLCQSLLKHCNNKDKIHSPDTASTHRLFINESVVEEVDRGDVGCHILLVIWILTEWVPCQVQCPQLPEAPQIYHLKLYTACTKAIGNWHIGCKWKLMWNYSIFMWKINQAELLTNWILTINKIYIFLYKQKNKLSLNTCVSFKKLGTYQTN